MSIMSTLLAAGFEQKKKMSEAEAEQNLEEILKAGEVATPAPKSLETRFEAAHAGGGVFYANEETTSPYTVFYLHGGAYRADFSRFHWAFLKRLIDATDAMVIAPAYRLVPFATWEDAFDLIMPLWCDYVSAHPKRKVILMGDSAGGGLSLAITEKLKEDGIRMADELILMSPWVDVAMDNPTIEAFTEVDPWLWPESLRVCGRSWAGEVGTNDWHVSPICGDLSGIGHVTLFTGTEEVLLPDSLRFFEKLDRNTDNKLIVGDGMMHVYPLMPIPEAHQAQQEIFERVMR